METQEKKLDYWKTNAEEDYLRAPISVLAYISELEKTINSSTSPRINNQSTINVEKLNRKLNRLKEKRDKLINEHKEKELEYTYWGGYELGYLKGKISIIEDIFDELEINT